MYRVYMYIESINRIVHVEDCEHFTEALRHCTLYYNRNPKQYIIWDTNRDKIHYALHYIMYWKF